MSFSELFKTKRQENGMTQEKIAEQLGVEEKTVSAWECGRIQAPDPALWKDIGRILDVPISEIYSSAFDDGEYLTIPHLIKREEFEKRLVSEELPFKKGLEPLMESYMAEHKISDDMCWDYKLMLTRGELEVCLFFIESFPETDVFDIYDKIISPCLMHNVRMKIAEKGKSEGGET